ncbi:MAG: trigger factor [Eubacteriales bacterium]|nr:trigger factor [Eubacteriales bacterium]
MKKKTCLAILAMCAALTMTACGDDGKKQEENQSGTETQQEENNTEDEQKAEEPKSFGTRLVSVDNVDKYVTIGEYKGLVLDNTVEEVTDDEIDAQIQTEMKNKAEEVTDKNGTVQEGDLVTVNFVGTKDGEAFDGGTANNYDITVGDGGFIPGFEEGIIGMKKGETKDVDVTFPEEYPQEDLAGQPAVFKITLQNFRRVQELTDAWVAKNTEYTTVDEYRAGVKKDLEETARANAESNLRSTAWSTILNNSEVMEYPQEDVDNAVTEFKKLMTLYAQQGNMELEDFVESQGISMDDFEEQCKQYAEAKVRQNLIVQGIMDAEGMSLDDKECLEIQEQMVSNYNAKDLEDLVAQHGQAAVNEAVGLMRVETFVVENAKVEEKVSNGELVGESGDGGDESKGIDEGIVDEEEDAGTGSSTGEAEDTQDKGAESGDNKSDGTKNQSTADDTDNAK